MATLPFAEAPLLFAAVLTLLAILAASLGYGRFWMRLLGCPPGRLDLFCAVALGLGTLAYLVLAVGLVGWLSKAVLVMLLAAGIALAPARLQIAICNLQFAICAPTVGVVLYLLLLVAATFVYAVRPVDGLEWDSLSYHLAAPKIYLHDGRIGFIAYDSHTHFPFTMQMLYTVGLAFGGPAGAKLVHWAAGWLTALAVGRWTAGLSVGGQPVPAWTGPLAAALFVSMPLVLWEMGTAYVDLGTALFQFLALVALLDAVSADPRRLEKLRQGAVLAGVLTGFALGTKMTALLQWGLLGLGLLYLACRAEPEARGRAVRSTMTFGLLGLLVGSPWYVKSWLWVHNPVYPFFFRFFPHSYSWKQQFAEAYEHEQRSFGLGRGLEQLLAAPWNLGIHARAFYIAGPRNLIGDRLGSLGPAWVGMLPLLPWARGLGWQVRTMLVYAAASVGLWFLLSHQSRYLMPVFAPLAAVAAATLAAMPARPLRIAGGAFCTLALAFSAWMFTPLVERALPYALGQQSEADYFRGDADFGAVYEAARYADSLPESSRIAFYQETRGFYFNRRYFWGNPGQHNLIPYDELRNWQELRERLGSFGITHVLINYTFSGDQEAADYFRLLTAAIREGGLREVFRSTDAIEGRRGVILYEWRL